MEIHISRVTLEMTNKQNEELSLENIEKAITFAKRLNRYFNVVLYEPLSHSCFFRILKILKKHDCENIAIVINGGCPLQMEYLIELSKFESVTFFIKMDSAYRTKNDRIKNRTGAFEDAKTTIQMLSDSALTNISCYIEMMLRKETIRDKINDEMNDMLIFAQTNRCNGIILSPEIICFDSRNFVSKECFKNLLDEIHALQQKYNSRHFFVGTAEPLMRLLSMKGFSCPAGISSFNMTATGIITPCHFLQIPLDVSSPESYKNSDFIRAMLNRNLKGKCAECFNKCKCIGCRARAFNATGDFLSEDPYCFI